MLLLRNSPSACFLPNRRSKATINLIFRRRGEEAWSRDYTQNDEGINWHTGSEQEVDGDANQGRKKEETHMFDYNCRLPIGTLKFVDRFEFGQAGVEEDEFSHPPLPFLHTAAADDDDNFLLSDDDVTAIKVTSFFAVGWSVSRSRNGIWCVIFPQSPKTCRIQSSIDATMPSYQIKTVTQPSCFSSSVCQVPGSV